MALVNPLLLAGAALVVVPIVLHLIMQQKPQHLEFPALRLVRRRHETNQRRLRLRHLLLLLLRAAAIALLAFALARPSFQYGSGVFGGREAPVAAALVFDTSPRMEYRHKNRTRLEEARQLGTWLLAQLPRDSQLAVLDTQIGPASFQVDLGAAKQRVERLRTAAAGQPLGQAIDGALQLLAESDLPQREIYIFTDLAEVAWQNDVTSRLQQRLQQIPGVGVYLVDLGVGDPTDYSLGELELSGQVLSDRSPLRINGSLTAVGAGGERSVELYLLEDGKPQKRSQQTLDTEANQTQGFEMGVGSLDIGVHQGYVKMLGQDALPVNDTRYFTVEVTPPWRILLAAVKPPERYAVYLAEALAPELYRRTGQARFDCQVTAIDRLTENNLDQFDAVCLLDPKPLAPAVWRALADYVSGGGGVAVFLGGHAQPVDTFNHDEAQEVLPGKLAVQARYPDGKLHIASGQWQHPILTPLAKLAGSVPWEAFPVYRYWKLDQTAEGVNVLIRYTDGQPALLERPVVDGRVLTMTTPVSDRPDRYAWNLLPVGNAWPFVVLSNQMMLYLVGSTDQQLNYNAGQTAVLTLPPSQQRQNYLVQAPGDLKFSVSAEAQQRTLSISATEELGNYRVRAGGEQSGVDLGFSVNLPPEKTRLDRVSNELLDSLFGDQPYRIARDRSQIERDVSMGRVGWELFPLLIVVVALLLAAEYVMANRFYPS